MIRHVCDRCGASGDYRATTCGVNKIELAKDGCTIVSDVDLCTDCVEELTAWMRTPLPVDRLALLTEAK